MKVRRVHFMNDLPQRIGRIEDRDFSQRGFQVVV
jgi:hypothetical protein